MVEEIKNKPDIDENIYKVEVFTKTSMSIDMLTPKDTTQKTKFYGDVILKNAKGMPQHRKVPIEANTIEEAFDNIQVAANEYVKRMNDKVKKNIIVAKGGIPPIDGGNNRFNLK